VPAPSLRSLQAYNLLTGLGILLSIMTATAEWNRAGWSERSIGIAMTVVNISYALLVFLGGRMSDGWGRGKTAVVGSAISASGCIVALVLPGPWTALSAAVMACGGSALFFPGNAGLFSDAVGEGRQASLPLHVKVSRYNLGWSCGNLGGFIGFSLLAHRPATLGFAIALGLFAFVTACMFRWIHLAPHPPVAEGDRAPHPALSRLTLMGRSGLLIICVITMAQIGLLQVVLRGMDVPVETAQRWAGLTLVTYASCYVAMFLLFGIWGGWVLKPWRLWFLQLPLLAGATGYVAMGMCGEVRLWGLMLCGACCGVAFGAYYTASIYYSMRLPYGAARAMALHETFLGVGNTAGPLLGGLFLDRWLAGGYGSSLFGFGAFAMIGVVLVFGLQLALIPGAVRSGAR
jgi:MFS family permease